MIFGFLSRLSNPRQERRGEPRGSHLKGFISIDGCDYPLKDWSRRGFSATGYRAGHYPGDKVDMSVRVDLAEDPLIFACRAVVVWVDRDRREIAGVFTHMDMQIQERIMTAIFARASGASENSACAPLPRAQNAEAAPTQDEARLQA
ncbi:hypothetical protein [Pelagibius sp.]|uniref:hypothetical protein n=1 Tax=Pelagibius sp. TaxID=1931238 RepID=UPI002630C09F|nr:hypothetical protein [Pelagibius sp.]